MMGEKRALVIGATRGLGRQICVDLIHKGIFVVGTYNKSNSIAKSMVKEFPGKILLIKSDFSKNKDINTLPDKVGKIDYIIFNVGLNIRKKFLDIREKDIDLSFQLSVKSPIFLIQKLYYNINHSGSILFIGSILGEKAKSVSLLYGVSKGVLPILVKYLSNILIERNIRVNLVSPGFIDTDWHKDKTPALRNKINNQILCKRFANVEEISSMCVESLLNTYLYGSCINIDGGFY